MAARWLKVSKDGKSFRFVPLFVPLEERAVPATYYVDPMLTGATGDIVTFNAGNANELAGLTFAANTADATAAPVAAVNSLRSALDAAEANADASDTIILATGAIPLDNSTTTFALPGGFGDFVNSIPVSGTLILRGDGAGATSILPTTPTLYDDGLGGGPVADDLTAVFRVDGAAATLTASNFTFDGNGKQIGAGFAVQNGASASFDGVTITDITFNPTGVSSGRAIATNAAATVNFANGTISNYGRVGIEYFDTDGAVTNSTIVGRGAGNYVNNGIVAQFSSNIAVAGNLISGNNGDVGGDQSSGLILADDDGFGTISPSTATVVGNTFTGNTLGVTVGAVNPDSSVLNASYNNFLSNTFGAFGGLSSTKQSLTNNFWGNSSGPFFPGGTGTGDAIDSDANLNVRPVLSYPTPRLTPADLTNFGTAISGYLDRITTLAVSIDPVGPATLTVPTTSVSFTVRFPVSVAANTTDPAPLRPTLNDGDFIISAPAGATTTVVGAGDTYTITVSGLTGDNFVVTATLPIFAAIDPLTGYTTAASNTASITVAVPPAANTAPTISVVTDRTLSVGGGSTGDIAFTVGDAETAPAALTVTFTSSNPAVVPAANVTLGGSGANRTVNVTGTATPGTSVITLTVTDAAGLSTSTAFAVTVPETPVVPPAPNTAPTITPATIPDQRLAVGGGTTGAIAFTVGDAETPAGDLVVTATSSNPAVTVVLGGSGANRTVTATAGENASGTITITVTDAAGLSTSTAFAVITADTPPIVPPTPVNTPPTITGNFPNITLLDTATSGPIAFTVTDDTTASADLVVSVVSSNPAVVPQSSLTLGGAGAARTLTVGGLPGAAGTSTITLTVRDAEGATSQRVFTVTVQNRTRLFAVAADAGSVPEVQVFGADGKARFSFLAFESSFTGGVRVATADFNGDFTDDIVVAAGNGGAARIRVISGATGEELANFYAYDPSFRGGAFVAAADITGSGTPSIITGAGVGGAPHVKAFNLSGGSILSFFAFDPAFRGGVTVAAADTTGDGIADIVTGAGPGGSPRVSAFNVASGSPTVVTNYLAFDAAYTGGVFVTAGSFGIAAAQGVGGNTEVRVLNGSKFITYESTVTGGVRLGSFDFGGDGTDEILTSAGPFGGARIQGYTATGQQVLNTFAFDTIARSGYFIG